jgi:hypothetical protein
MSRMGPIADSCTAQNKCAAGLNVFRQFSAVAAAKREDHRLRRSDREVQHRGLDRGHEAVSGGANLMLQNNW